MQAAHFTVGSACNNGCRGCLWTRRLGLQAEVSLPPPESIRGRGVRLAGREPTLRPDLGDVVAALRASGATSVEIETNGRMLAYAPYVRTLSDAGVTRLVVKLFGANEVVWDAHTRVPGSYAQTMKGIAFTRRIAPRIDLVALLAPRREPGAGLSELLSIAQELGFARVRIELRLAKLDLVSLPQLAADVRALRTSPPSGMKIDVSAS
jgi:molybdenum cofactor biosynthesis enzyme MoaA